MSVNDGRSPQQKKALRLALQAGRFRDIAIARGGTGDKRYQNELSSDERTASFRERTKERMRNKRGKFTRKVVRNQIRKELRKGA